MYYSNPSAFALALIGFILAAIAFNRSNKLSERLDDAERQIEQFKSEFQRLLTHGPGTAAEPHEPLTDTPDTTMAEHRAPDTSMASDDVTVEPDLSDTVPTTSPDQAEPVAPTSQKENFGQLPPAQPPAPTGPTFVDRVMDSFINNWVIWLAALSLAFGGIFIVQYGLERGFLGPVARVIAALGFGGLLILGAEYMRRQDPDGSSGVLTVPTALASGGIASLFAGVVSAHVLYDLTNPLVGFVSMAAVSWLALAGGLIYGPVLAVIGLLGAFISPFLVASDGPSPLMYLYFLLVLVASLAVERWQRWIWLSALAVTGALTWGLLLHWSLPNEPLLAAYSIGVILATVTIPAYGVLPNSPDTNWLTDRSFERISHVYPTMLAVMTALAASIILVGTGDDSLTYWQTTILGFLALLALSIATLRRAQNLDQLAAIFGLGLIAVVTSVDMLPNSYRLILFGADYDTTVRAYFPFAALGTLVMTALYIGASLWRASASVRPAYWHALTALLPLGGLVILWGKWSTTGVLTEGNWQFLFGVLVALLAGLAALLLRKSRDNSLGADILSCGGFLGLGVLFAIGLSSELQIIGFAALATCAFWIQARFGFHLLGWISLLYTSLTFGRIVLEPGLGSAIRDGWLEGPVFIAIATALFFAAARKASQIKAAASLVQFETATVAGAGVLASVLIGRAMDAFGRMPDNATLGLHITVWLILGLVQFKRASQIDSFTFVRKIFGWCYFGLSLFALLAGTVLLDPVFGIITENAAGIFPIDSLIIAYGSPALVLVASIKWPALPEPLPHKVGLGISGALGTWVLILEIRRFWHGNNLDAYKGILTPELYSYTVVLLIATIACVIAALLRRDPTLRKWGLGLVGITALKVFLWDMAGLQGLSRATAFIALGLTLAGIAWLFQKFATATPETPEEPEELNEADS